MRIGKTEIQAGEKRTGFLPVEGNGASLPFTVIRGGEGKTALVTAGVHNAEYPGIQAAIELAEELVPEQVKGTVIIVPLVNVSGFERRTMSMVYEDGKNLNRVFPGAVLGTAADRPAAAVVSELFSRADCYIDLHAGDGYEDLHPYAYYVGPVDKKVRETSFQMARRVNAEYLVESSCTTGGAYNYASAAGIPSILIERGGRGLWSREEVEEDKNDVRRVLSYFGILEGEAEPVREQTVFREVVYENAPESGCWYPAFRPGERVRKGDTLGEIRDYFGRTVHVCTAKGDGVLLYQTVSLTLLKGGPMAAYGLWPEEG